MELIKPKPMPIGVRNAFLLHSIIGFVGMMAAIVVCKKVVPGSTTWVALSAQAICLIGVVVTHVIHSRGPKRNDTPVRTGEWIISCSAYLFCAFAVATGITFAGDDHSGRMPASMMMLLNVLVALLLLQSGTDMAIGKGAEAVTARMRLRILPMMQVLCFAAVLSN